MNGRTIFFAIISIAAGLRFCGGCDDGGHQEEHTRSTHVAMRPIAPTRLCAPQAAWRRDDGIGRSSVADSLLWPGMSGHFGNGALLSLDHSDSAAQTELTAGGGYDPVEISALGLVDADRGESCGAAYHTHRPDLQVEIATSNFVRLYVVPRGESNPTMAIRTPDGHWRCNDDHGRSGWGSPHAAVIDLCDAVPGMYAVWLGSADGTSHNPATLYLTGDENHHP